MRSIVVCAGWCLLVLSGASCRRQPAREPAIGEAFAGPAITPLRAELGIRSDTVAQARHGELLEIIQVRRKFYKVRNAAGAEGWVDGRSLLSAEQMTELKTVAERARKLPSQGAATVLDALNVHTTANRQSPSFYRIVEGESIDVIGHRVAPRIPYQGRPLVPPPPKPPPRKKKKKPEPKYPPPPMPRAPAPPLNWLELSRTLPPEEPDEDEPAPPPEKPKPQEVPKEDWSLVRLKDGGAGWVLTRALVMSIPDEVAQYAEGQRITSYFSLGEVTDDGKKKHHWLWTTNSQSRTPNQFDGYRVFIYSLRRHRYETAFIQKNVVGYYPVLVTPDGATFSVHVEDSDGRLERRTYAFSGQRARLVERAPAQRADNSETGIAAAPAPSVPPPGDSILDSVKKRVKSLLGK